jgi:uncharacterized transporter YbjL
MVSVSIAFVSAGQEAGDGVETTFRRRGYLFIAFGILIVLYAVFGA